MANYPKKMMDPTEAALSAIQEALNIRDDEDDAEAQAQPQTLPEGRPEGMSDLFAGDPRSRDAQAAYRESVDTGAIGTRDLAAQSGRVANDDQQSIGQVLQALQQRPSRSSYFVATVFSCAWIVGCLALSWAYLSSLSSTLGSDHSPAALMVGLAAAALLPVIFFYGLAHMAWRAQELRLIAQSMARVAMRLAEPESVARDSIVTVGQAIRREVAAMGDGVERALARASELESLVQSEVAALERTYSDNEVRIRALLQELASQRDTLVGQAEQVRSAINNVQIDLTQDLSTISELVGQQVNEAAMRITHSLAERGENITVQLSQIGDNMVQQLSERGGDLLDRLETASDETSRAISAASDRLTSNLNFKTNHIGEEFAEIATGLEDMMTERLDRVTEGFSDKSLAVVDLMIGRSQELTDAIIETSSQLAEAIATRADEVNSTLKSSGESLILDLDLRGGEVASKLQQVGDGIAEQLVARSTTMTDSMRESAEHVAGVMATRSDAVKETLTTRLAAFEEMFSHTGAELGERISRDSSTLGNLITRHLAEFDRTVKTYGSELVERLGARTQDVSESMRSYVDNFDSRVTAKANEVTNVLDQRLTRFQEAIDSRSQTLTDALSARIVEISKTLNENGKEVVATLDKRITDVTTIIDARTVKLTDTISDRIANIDSSLGKGALEVAKTLDSRVGHLEQLLGGRAEAIIAQMETHSRAAGDQLGTRFEQIAESIKTNSAGAERALAQLAASTNDVLGKSAAASTAATEALNRSAAEATVSLNRSAGTLANTITKSAAVANEAIGKSTAGAADLLAKSTQTVTEQITRSATDAERKLVGMSTEVSRNVVGKANEINTALTQRVEDMTRILDEKSNTLITALTTKGQSFAGEVGRITDQTVKAIEAKGFVFTQTMVDKSEEIARQINDASLNATAAATRTLGQMQEGVQGVTDGARLTLTRTLEDLHHATRSAIEQSKQTAAATIAEMMETHTMLRSDSTALFERLREANILLQEVLSGAQENMSSIEHTMASRISEFVAAMNELSTKSGATTNKVEQHLGAFNNVTSRVLNELGDLADQFSSHGRTLTEAVELLETSNRRTEDSMVTRQATIDTLVSALDARTEDFGQRLARFSGLLDESLDTATTRAREIAGVIAETSTESLQTLEQQYDLVRKNSDEERKRTSEALNAVYDEALGEVQGMFNQSTSRFTEVMVGMKQMAAEMQQELETTRNELRRGILELPQETSESAAQMRRVIVDQIEALAELNRIVARHGRSLDAVEPARREAEPLYAAGGGRGAQPRPIRPDMAPHVAPHPAQQTAPYQPAPPRDITGAPRRSGPPNLSPVPGSKDDSNARNGGGWLSDLLTRASREEGSQPASQGATQPLREGPPRDDRSPRDPVDSIDSLSVDIARMIDHDAAAELWERYKRGERGVFNRRLYTPQGAKAFDEIRAKYRADPEFRQTVEHYIHEFERLLDDVSRGDRGPAVARNYLTSDTGKVYTMLAHAAGRFD
jgi:Apolipoprotein A1/A4/E domain